MSWSAVQEFIKKLNLETGRHFRLPTDAEWEFAAKGGIYSKEYRYAGSNDLDEIAWCKRIVVIHLMKLELKNQMN